MAVAVLELEERIVGDTDGTLVVGHFCTVAEESEEDEGTDGCLLLMT